MDPSSSTPGGAVVPVQLNGWKEIAAFFGKGVRTVQRWERNLGRREQRAEGGEPRGP